MSLLATNNSNNNKILLIKLWNLNQDQLEPFITAELYALATLIMDSATAPRGPGTKKETLNKSSRSLSSLIIMSQEERCKIKDSD